ncbi:glycosyltransferase family 87 protein [Nocardioides houyundeii]|uniref:glycosyltransferase family 87 protein n=1 Tax=Nocardioides houyundeii TaxID=2045452 RepID=UPI000C77CF04|nr:glycosyltransferase family 87 protein [Nocardioides houyundeii]
MNRASRRSRSRSPQEPRSLRGALVLGCLLGLWVGSLLAASIPVLAYLPHGGLGYDAHAYWLATRADEPYGAAPGAQDAYLYSPLFLQLITPIGLLPWPAFLTIWMAVEIACLLWLTRPLPLRWRVPVLLLCLPEILFGNIYGLLGVMVCLGFKRPGLWAFAFLTKITIGLVGLVWFAARGEWRAVGWIVACTTVLAGASALAQPQLWVEWLQFLRDNSGSGDEVSRAARLGVALAVVYLRARHDQRWTVSVSMLLAVPHFEFKNKDFAILTAIPRLVRFRAEEDDRGGRPAERDAGHPGAWGR